MRADTRMGAGISMGTASFACISFDNRNVSSGWQWRLLEQASREGPKSPARSNKLGYKVF